MPAMSVGGDDDTIASAVPTASASMEIAQLVANRYRIVRWLGGGGMGRVYEALDTELDERIALKVLRGGMADDVLERFRREVRLTRRIQHRNVARMFDIGEHDGDRFLTMELIEGDALTRELGRSMPWHRLQSLAVQICDGLAAAHRVGVVHRDLKPDNVIVERTTDRAVITDFGIARSIDDASVTQVGAVIGTPRYMAPEQLAGRGVDARADLFSLGVMLYELASGIRPWSGDSAIAIAVAQATQPARPLASSQVPAMFAELVMRCLERDPARRPATAAELSQAIASADAGGAGVTPPALPGAPPPVSPPTMIPAAVGAGHETALAVLPLACGPGDEYLADGVLEDLIDTLSSTPTLRVRPAGIVRARVDPDPRELGRQLEVDHVVVGSLRRTPGGLRLSARLIGVADGFQIWAHRTDCSEAEILTVSEQLGRGIAGALSARATGQTRPTDPRAVELYLRARAELRRFWGSHVQAAAELLEEAAAIAPGSVPIAGALAFASVQAWVMQTDPTLIERARAALERGLALGPPEAYLASATFRFNTGDSVGGAADLGTALLRAPMLGQAHEMAGRILVEVGEVAQARQHFTTATALDPTRAHLVSADLARLDALEGWWERADRALAVIVADPDRSIAQLGGIFQARLAGWRGDRRLMTTMAETFAPRLGPYAGKLLELASRAAETGSIDRAAWPTFLQVFGGAGRPQRGQLMGLQLLSEIAIVLGNTEAALDTLEAADRMGLIDIVVLDRCPLFDRVLDEPRFQAVRGRVAERAALVLAAFRSAAG